LMRGRAIVRGDSRIGAIIQALSLFDAVTPGGATEVPPAGERRYPSSHLLRCQRVAIGP
jgi:hypothetical protein